MTKLKADMSPKKADIIFIQNYNTKIHVKILIEHKLDQAFFPIFQNIWVKEGLFTFFDDKQDFLCLFHSTKHRNDAFMSPKPKFLWQF